MIDFLYDLYKNDNFTIYLTIALVILIILFVVVLLFGKKDQKLEETKRLQKLEVEGFKEEDTSPAKIEVKEQAKDEVKVPEAKVDETVNITEFMPNLSTEVNMAMQNEAPAEEPVKPHLTEEDNKPINFEEFNKMPMLDDEDDSTLITDLSELDNIKKEFNSIDIPDIKDEVKEDKPAYKPSSVFSSVYVNSEADNKAKENNQSSLFTILDDEEEVLDLPQLNEETKPKNEDTQAIDFSNFTGETYKINK